MCAIELAARGGGRRSRRSRRRSVMPTLLAGLGDVDGVLQEDHRVVVGEGHAAAAERRGGARDRLRATPRRPGCRSRATCEMSQFWQNRQARLQPAVPNDSTGVPGQEVVERLLLDGIDAEAAGAAVRGQHDLRRPRARARSTGRAGPRAACRPAGRRRTGRGRRRGGASSGRDRVAGVLHGTNVDLGHPHDQTGNGRGPTAASGVGRNGHKRDADQCTTSTGVRVPPRTRCDRLPRTRPLSAPGLDSPSPPGRRPWRPRRSPRRAAGTPRGPWAGTPACSQILRQWATWASASSLSARSASADRSSSPILETCSTSVQPGSTAQSTDTSPCAMAANAAAVAVARSEGPEPSTATRILRGTGGSG